VALDKLDKVGAGAVQSELVSRGLDEDVAQRLLATFAGAAAVATAHPDAASFNREMLAMLEAELGAGSGAAAGPPADTPAAGLATLNDIVRLAAGTSAAAHVRLDPSLARGLSYYTGAIMEIAVPDLAGSLGGGGRYDGLIGMFSGEQVPACGFSLGLERILVVMSERQMFPADVTTAPADVLVTLWSAERTPDALAVAASLRASGVRVDVYPEADKLGKQFKYAASRGFPFVVVTGDDEAARGEVTVKNMKTGEQQSVARQDVAGLLGQNRR
jgi:histidyl-tRNA synthetase